VTCSFKPDLARAERAVVEVLHHGVSVDILDVPADEGYETWKHPVLRAETYAEALR